MIDRLRNLLKSDDFIPTTSVFPEIDVDKIDRELKLKDRAAERGKANLPKADEASLDAVEMDIITRIEGARRSGLENYEHNRGVYTRRLRSAHTARSEIETITGKARGDFASEVKSYRAEMTKIVDDVVKWDTALETFKVRNGLERPAFDRPSMLKTAAIVLAFLIVETVLNGALFAEMNDLGLIGGGFIALLISIVNVGASGLSGTYARLAVHRNFLIKLAGLLIIAVWFCFSVVLNFAVAHFRDALDTLGNWPDATQAAIRTLVADPLGLLSVNSWLLAAWGMLIAILTFLKFRVGGEPYPGYARISERRRRAVEEFEEILDDALDSIESRRNDSIEQLNEASDLVRERIGDAIDALYGRRMMHSHLQAFLEQCDVKATSLLKRYRDENRMRRTEDAPAHFDESYRFAAFLDGEVTPGEGDAQRTKAEAKIEEVETIVDQAIAAIHNEYAAALDEYSDMDELISVDMKDKAKARRDKIDAASANSGVTKIGSAKDGRKQEVA